jgi:type VI secretion system protein ImpF
VRGYTGREMMNAVLRDLEDLLNTRRTSRDLPEEWTELQRSIVEYGLPDLTSLDAMTAKQQEAIGRVLEAAVTLFEPRLRHVRATLVNAANEKTRTVRFHIEARLCVEPAPEGVSFETVLELTTGHYSVNAADR